VQDWHDGLVARGVPRHGLYKLGGRHFGPSFLFFLIVSSGPAQIPAPFGVTRTLRWLCDGCKSLSFYTLFATDRISIYLQENKRFTFDLWNGIPIIRRLVTVKISNNKAIFCFIKLRSEV
jgi:hypothetical protein